MILLAPSTNENIKKLGYSYWLAIIILTILLRFIVGMFFLNDMPLISDAESYYQEAKEMTLTFPGSKAYYWPPGTSYILSAIFTLFGSSVFVTKLFTILVSSLYSILVIVLAASLYNNTKAIKFSGLIAACYPPIIMMSAQPYSHHFSALLLVLTLIIILNYSNEKGTFPLILVGVILGFSALVRPSSLVLLVLVLIYISMDIRRYAFGSNVVKRFGSALLVLISTLSCISPIIIFNAKQGAGFTLSTNNERNFFLGNNRYTPNYKTSHFGQVPSSSLEPSIAKYLDEMRGNGTLSDRKRMTDAAVDYIKQEPFIFAKRTLNRIKAFWGVDYAMSREIQKNYSLNNKEFALLMLFEAGGYFLVMVLGFISFFLLPVEKSVRSWQPWLLLLLAIVFYQAPYAVAFSAGIYHYPVMLIVMVFSGLSLATPLGRLGEIIKRPWQRILCFSIFIIFLLIQIEYLMSAMKYVT